MSRPRSIYVVFMLYIFLLFFLFLISTVINHIPSLKQMKRNCFIYIFRISLEDMKKRNNFQIAEVQPQTVV